MKKLQLLTTVFTVIIILLCNPIVAQDLLWYGDPDKSVNSSFRRFDAGNFPNDYCSDQSDNASTVGTTNDSEHGKVWRIRKPKGQKRGEFARTTGTSNYYEPKDGDRVYYGWRWKINSNPDINNGIAVWQWKTDAGGQNNTQNYPLSMGYSGGNLSLFAHGPCYPKWNSCSGSINKRRTTLWTKYIPENTWVTFVVGIKMSRNDDIGHVEFWYNGAKQTLKNSNYQDYQVGLSSDKKRAYHKTFDGKVVYPKWGSYNGNACNFNTTTYYDEMRIGKTLSSVLDPLGGSSTDNDNGGGLSGTYYFQNVATGRYLDSNGANLTTNTSTSGKDKQWNLVTTDNGYYNIDSNFSGRGVLESQDNKIVKGSNVEPNTNGSKNNNREWKPESKGNGIYIFLNRVNGRYYLAERTNNNSIEHTGWDGPRAQWRLINVDANKVNTVSDQIDLDIAKVIVAQDPITKNIMISLRDPTQSNIRIYGITGQLMYQKTISEKSLTISNSGQFTPGIYMVQIKGENEPMITKKLLIL